MKKINDVKEVLRILHKEYPDSATSLKHKNALEMLISTILSAQCTDKRVNIVTKKLFKKYREASDYADADLKELEQDIRSTGFYKNKARNIKNCCRILIQKHKGRVPRTMEELVELPGVGRKTANVVLGAVFDKAEGFVVDTHVSRLSFRIGLTNYYKKPEKIEKDLMKLFPKKEWIFVSNALIWHGRKVCNARVPYCSRCSLNRICLRKKVLKFK